MADPTSAKSSGEHSLGDVVAMIQALVSGQQAMRLEVSGALQAMQGETLSALK